MEATSSTEQMPMPYAFHKARLTARVSATRISAPCISGETLEGSASPYPTNPLHVLVLNTEALKAQRCAAGSKGGYWLNVNTGAVAPPSETQKPCVSYIPAALKKE